MKQQCNVIAGVKLRKRVQESVMLSILSMFELCWTALGKCKFTKERNEDVSIWMKQEDS